jgi:hypothetical protein
VSRIRLAVALLVAGALIALGVATCGESADGPRPTPAAAAPETPSRVDPPPAPTPRRERPTDLVESSAPATTSADPKTAFVLDVTVLRVDGTPAPAARVVAQLRESDPGYGLGGPVMSVYWATTDGRGRASFEFPASKQPPFDRVIAYAGEDAACGEFRRDVDARANVTLRLARGLSIAGRVLDADGDGVADAEVRLVLAHPEQSVAWRCYGPTVAATTRSDGSFALPPLPPGEVVHAMATVSASARGFAPGRFDLPWSKIDDAAPVELRLLPAVYVRGRCVDAQGRPLSGVTLGLGGESVRAESDQEGRFEIPGLTAEPVTLWALKPPLAPTRVLGLRGDARDLEVGDLVLREGGTVRGIVVDGEGRPISGVHVALDRGHWCVDVADTGADGRFVMENVGEGEHVFGAQARPVPHGFAALGVEFAGVVADGPELRVVLDGGRLLRLRLVDDVAREPVVASRVDVTWRVSRPGAETHAWAYADSPVSAVRLLMPEAGRHDLDVDAFGFEPRKLKAVDVEAHREVVVDVPLHRRQ